MLKTYKPKEPIKFMEEVPLIVEQKRFLADLLEPSPEKKDYTEQPAAYLEDEPREFRDKVLYLCLRGLREGFLQFMDIHRITDPINLTSSRTTGFSYNERHYDFDKKEVIKTGSRIDTIEECIKKRLLEDPLIRKCLDWNNTQSVFEANCENIASSVASNYVCQIRRKELKKLGLV